MTILDELSAHAKERVKESKKNKSLEDIKTEAYSLKKGGFEFEKALKKPGVSFICEVKKASPSKGIIAEVFDPLSIAKEYEAAGADCISVLTEPKWFLGSNDYLKEIAATVSIPCIRKDFTVDPYMIYEAKVLGAKAVLLIVSILSTDELKEYLGICEELGLSALVETHDEIEIETALSVGARLIGVNNRNLKDFSVDTGNAGRLKSFVPDNVIFVSESGIRTREDIVSLEKAGIDAVLIGETLMRAHEKRDKLNELKGIS